MVKVVVGIESTAHTFGVGFLDMNGKILSNVKDSYTTAEGGMIPLDVRAHHARVSGVVFAEALKVAGVGEEDIECVAFSNAPGLAPCLLEGMDFSKKKAKELGISIVGVNHCVAHLVVGETCGAKDPVMLYASGANTQIVGFEDGRFRVFGETLDLGVGNFIDSIGRTMGLGFPSGPKIEKLAEEYGEKFKPRTSTDSHGLEVVPELLELPYVVKGMDVSLSGIQTKIRNLLSKGEDKGKLAYALQEVVFAMLVEVAERALAHTGKRELLIGGGVGCNDLLQEMCRKMCFERSTFSDRCAGRSASPGRPLELVDRFASRRASPELAAGEGVKFFCPPRDLLVDNGAMIGYLGLKMFKAGLGVMDLGLVDIAPRERTDEVICDSWR